jgi:hypothetical protein
MQVDVKAGDNGNVLVEIPLLSVTCRELDTGLKLTYNSQKWQYHLFAGRCPGGLYNGGWRLADPSGSTMPHLPPAYSVVTPHQYVPLLLGCAGPAGTWRIDVYWEDGLGTKRRYSNPSVAGSCNPANPPKANPSLVSEEGDGTVFYSGANPQTSGIRFKDGTVIRGS